VQIPDLIFWLLPFEEGNQSEHRLVLEVGIMAEGEPFKSARRHFPLCPSDRLQHHRNAVIVHARVLKGEEPRSDLHRVQNTDNRLLLVFLAEFDIAVSDEGFNLFLQHCACNRGSWPLQATNTLALVQQ